MKFHSFNSRMSERTECHNYVSNTFASKAFVSANNIIYSSKNPGEVFLLFAIRSEEYNCDIKSFQQLHFTIS